MKFILCSMFICATAFAQVGSPGNQPVDRFFVVAIDTIDVPGKEAGAMTDLLVEEGQLVEVDQQLAQIDDTIARMQVNVAKSKMNSAIVKAKSDVNKLAALAQTRVYEAELATALDANSEVEKTVSLTELRRLEFRVTQGKLSAKQADHEKEVAKLDALAAREEMNQAKAMVEQRKIKSPVAGMVDKVYLRKGNWVAAGEPVIHVVRLDKLRVKGTLNAEKFSPAIVRNKSVVVTVTLAGNDATKTETFNATIGHASPNVNTDGHFEVWAELQNRRDANGNWVLTPGLDATIKFR